MIENEWGIYSPKPYSEKQRRGKNLPFIGREIRGRSERSRCGSWGIGSGKPRTDPAGSGTTKRKQQHNTVREVTMEDLNTQKLETLPIMFTTTEVAQILGVTQRTLYNWIKDETLEAVNVNGRWRITKDALQSFIDRGKKKGRRGAAPMSTK